MADAKTLEADRPIEFHASAEVPVSGDDARLEQMVHNLLGNALAHTPKGTPVDVGVAVRGDHAVLEVRDRGPGLSPDQARHVFDRFYRADVDRLDGGSGLGLYIVRLIAEFHGGVAKEFTVLARGRTSPIIAWLRALAADAHGSCGGPGVGAVGTLASIDRGSGPPVVLLHGQPGSGAAWDLVTQRLAPGFRVLAPDRPGYGQSSEEALGLAGHPMGAADMVMKSRAHQGSN